MLRVGFIGWRGMVGSVLMQRMREENDFAGIEPVFFSTSNVGGAGPQEARRAVLQDARDLHQLATCDVLMSCQGGDYTTEVFAPLRKSGWQGYWIDAASTLRMADDAVIVLDPVNGDVIQRGLASGVRSYIGGNCTVSLMLMAMAGLLREGLVEWITTMTYQAASGAGAAKMLQLVEQMGRLVDPVRKSPSENALEVDRMVIAAQRSDALPTQEFGAPLAGSLLAWIDKEMPGGQTREEWKGMAETNKIMGLEPSVPVDGICVRVGTMRCHSQGLVIKLNKDLPLPEIEQILARTNEWVRVVPNNKEATLRDLTPTSVSGRLDVAIGRLHKLKLGPQFLGAFTVGDQLLWGAAEPLRRMLNILRQHLGVASERQLVSARE
ncbi:MAG TPA: aspartate-semialdehyde dehydrogenase [Candidatus Sulfotelmatobacter sp.]|nr:aspartate-semialdehyde dehydrogenase [Candidatus Sulfotelmatobacter sp.]